MEFYAGQAQCLARSDRIERSDTDVFLDPDHYDANIWHPVASTSVSIDELDTVPTYVRVSIRGRDESNNGLGFYIDDAATGMTNPQLTGLWYDPDTSGQGWKWLYTPGGLTGYFYGFADSGEPLWLITSPVVEGLEIGEAVTVELLRPVSGSLAAPSEELEPWGEATLTFESCTSATVDMSGEDGAQEQSVVRLARIANIPGC